MKLNRNLVLVLALVLSVAMATTGTLAYLTDRDSAANVFTFGDVSIQLNEDFQQGATLIPGVDVEKDVKVTNTGKNDAWVWVKIAIPSELDNDDASKNVLHFNYSKDSVADGQWTWTDNNGNWLVEKNVEKDDIAYNVYSVLYRTALKPNDQTQTSAMWKVYLDTKVDVDPNGDLYVVKNGEAVPVMKNDTDKWNIATDTIMYVSAYAIQTEGFKDVWEAYAAYNTQWGDNGTEWGTPATMAQTPEELLEAIKAGNSAVANNSEYNVFDLGEELDAQGATVTLNGSNSQETYHGYLGFLGDNVTVSNLNVTGSGFVELGEYGNGGEKHVANNLVLRNMTSTLANSDKGFTLACTFMSFGEETVLNNCVMTGAKAMVEGALPFDIGFGQPLTPSIASSCGESASKWTSRASRATPSGTPSSQMSTKKPTTQTSRRRWQDTARPPSP